MRRTLALACVPILMVVQSHAASANVVTSPRTLTFTVVGPDGTPAADATAFVWVQGSLDDGVRAQRTYVADAGRDGTVRVTVPMTDPEIASQFPAKRIFPVHVNVFTFGPDHHPNAFNAVDYILNFGDPSYPIDFAGVQGAVLDLVAVPAGSHDDAVTTRTDPGDVPNGETCAGTQDLALPGGWSCVATSHPDSIKGEHVVVAHNIGADTDMTTLLQIDNAKKVSTSTVVGVNGSFIEARGSTNIEKTLSQHFGFTSLGTSSPDEDAVLLTDFAQVDHYACHDVDRDGTGECYHSITFVPETVQGEGAVLEPTSEPIYHGYATDPGPTDTDCTVGVQSDFSNSRGVNKEESFSFGFSYDGGSRSIPLHANMIVESTNSGEVLNTYRWYVSSRTLPYHHVFVPFGQLGASDAGATCPVNSPGSTWTDTSTHSKENLRPAQEAISEIVVTPPQLDPVVNDAYQRGRRCVEAPERCGRE
jgi:hypothetical protein